MICRNEALQHIRNNLCEAEIEFFNEYCSSLAEFQAGIGENGVNLLLSTHPPKALYVQVGHCFRFRFFFFCEHSCWLG
ncbi:hypothetical protein TELCIR_26309 [Teladorsagia circumcincta]|uniref:Uncharacterized protein n=1 Tax=Teladorsagia circumcincta TaxID=45464 RepID=A0A2G9T3B4_TELCI|nr:hypothetical protein TELCIR_26309 [Teladorsagia circumcincta]